MGDGRTAVYDIDLDNMKLSEDYRVYWRLIKKEVSIPPKNYLKTKMSW